MNRIFYFLFFIFLSVSCAVEINKIETEMRSRIDKSLQILQNNNNKQEVANEIFKLFDSMFDYELMAKLSLSKEYANLTQEEKDRFVKYYKNSLQQSFANKLELYKDETIEIVGGEKVKSNRYNLTGTIVIDGTLSNIIFKFYPNGDDWLIYDVDIVGVSLIQTYRSQFADILNHGSMDDIFKKLQGGDIFVK